MRRPGRGGQKYQRPLAPWIARGIRAEPAGGHHGSGHAATLGFHSVNRHIRFARPHNFRSAGGYTAAEGRTVRRGRQYRSDSLGNIRGEDGWTRTTSSPTPPTPPASVSPPRAARPSKAPESAHASRR
ncbi:tyrosine-protein phosphatase [Streptomyces sp. NBC_01800]|uniref:tyrosine-protein phosphatase n=1 Tax=Streptomyces sp. NBC_01800 TaxID=2975945 RepID=UPI002DDC8142|nr:tyrosine-protein phosphatase [Streptomyces sp. NBC_01800]WSA73611.1 tyrosine-protein phosphatase [Streptomyces sp. NBC_01800]